MNNGQLIGIVAALPFEINVLKEMMENAVVETIAGSKYYLGTICNQRVVFMQCGMGKVSAGAGVQVMITKYQPDCIINTGCAGALAEELNIGDIVLADKTIEWDLDTMAIGNPRGYVSAMDRIEMFADSNIVNELAEVINDSKVYRGLIVSGDQFVSTNEQRNLIKSAFPDALCAEMEGASIGHVCSQNGIPFCVIRCISDNANGDSGINFAEFAEMAGKKSAEHLISFLKKYK